MPNRNLSSDQICKAFSISEATLDRYCQDGLQFDKADDKRGKPRSFSKAEVAAFIKSKTKPLAGNADELTAVKTAKELELAERYRVENDREDAKLIQASAVREHQQFAKSLVCAKLDELPGRIASAIDGLDGAESHDAFDGVIMDWLNELRDS